MERQSISPLRREEPKTGSSNNPLVLLSSPFSQDPPPPLKIMPARNAKPPDPPVSIPWPESPLCKLIYFKPFRDPTVVFFSSLYTSPTPSSVGASRSTPLARKVRVDVPMERNLLSFHLFLLLSFSRVRNYSQD